MIRTSFTKKLGNWEQLRNYNVRTALSREEWYSEVLVNSEALQAPKILY